MKHIMRSAAAGVASLALLVVSPTAANAAGKDGVLDSGEFGLYYVANQGLPVFDLFTSDDNFLGDTFPGRSIGANDNTESYRNRDSYYWHVYTDAYGGGAHGCLPPGYVGNASTTFKNKISSAYYRSYGC